MPNFQRSGHGERVRKRPYTPRKTPPLSHMAGHSTSHASAPTGSACRLPPSRTRWRACGVRARAPSRCRPTSRALGACITAADCSVFDVEYNPQGESSTNSRMWRAMSGTATTGYRASRHHGTCRAPAVGSSHPPSNLTPSAIPSIISICHPPRPSATPSTIPSAILPATCRRYEPLRVATRRVDPTFDERFHGYGKNKVELIIHLR